MSAAMALVKDPRSAAEYIGTVLNGHYSRFKGTAKVVGKIARTTDRNGENYLQGKNCPNLTRFLLLAQHTPELNAAVTWLMRNGPAHPEAAALIAKLEAMADALPEEGDQIA